MTVLTKEIMDKALSQVEALKPADPATHWRLSPGTLEKINAAVEKTGHVIVDANIILPSPLVREMFAGIQIDVNELMPDNLIFAGNKNPEVLGGFKITKVWKVEGLK
ncbi:MAG: hypothetical protein GY938_24505 [Ketobacter sp.]|nr:hypothetical protein [Ketobacter sp.]